MGETYDTWEMGYNAGVRHVLIMLKDEKSEFVIRIFEKILKESKGVA